MLNGRENAFYLKSGARTEIGPNVRKLAELIHGKNTGEIVNSIMSVMVDNIKCDTSTEEKTHANSKDPKKFKRSAEEIITDNYRNGCCDSSTLFVALARAKGIPAAQIITANMADIVKDNDFGSGHFFSAYYNKEKNKWIVIDSHKTDKNLDENKVCHGLHKCELLPNMKFLMQKYYIFACTRDYSEFCLNGTKIDSIKNIHKIHKYVYQDYLRKEKLLKDVEDVQDER